MNRSLTRRELAVIFAFWTSLAVLSSVNWLLDPRGPAFRPMDPTRPTAMLRSPGGGYAVRLKDGTKLSVSRARRDELERRLGIT